MEDLPNINPGAITIFYTPLRPAAVQPTCGSQYSAGWDLYSAAGATHIGPGETKMMGTALAVEIPEGYFGAIFARSGLASKEGLRPANCVGVIDSDYRGEIKIALHNDSSETRLVPDGARIAQMVVIPYLPIQFQLAEELSETERGEGGFGSTGK